MLRDRGEYGRARACFVEAADAFRATGNRGDMVEVLAALAVEASRRGAAARAFVLAGAVDAATRTPGVVLYAVALEEIEAGLARVRGALPPEDAARARERGRAMTIPEALDWALTAET